MFGFNPLDRCNFLHLPRPSYYVYASIKQVTLKNDMPRPLRIALSRENQRQPRTVLPVDSEVCIPFPVLRDEALRLWRSPRTLVGGDALRRALDKDSKRGRTSGWIEQTSAGDRRGQGQEEETDEGEEVSVNITPSMFDRTRKVVERHSKRHGLVDT